MDAAAASERVDYTAGIPAGSDESLVLGWFAYVEFRGETYDASSSFEGFAGEASYNYELADVNQSQVEADRVVEYANLTDAERDIADAMLENGSFDIGHHEQRPPATETFEGQHYLRTANETYQIRVMVSDYAHHHMLTLDAGEPTTNVAVVTIADRAPSQAVSDVLTKAAADGPARATNADAIRAYLDGVDYVVTATAVVDVQFVQAAE